MTFNQVVQLFVYLHSKDGFLIHYSKLLAKRLINKTLLAMEYEELMLSKLKSEAGINQISNLVKMVRDIKQSKDLILNYREQTGETNVTFGVEVIQQGVWHSVANNK